VTTYPTSSYIDNGEYYLGRSYFGQQLYVQAIPAFTAVFDTPGSIYEDNAVFFIGRSHYHQQTPTEITASLTQFEDLITSFPTSQYVDNSMRWEVQAYVDLVQCADAQARLNDLNTQFSSSTETARAQTYYDNAVTNGVCP
jgi:TolA-binding protein